jgi:8-oxo-dGTP diphosphatase
VTKETLRDRYGLVVHERPVVGAVLVSGGRVLLCHRSRDREWFPDVWDLPGGHVDHSESPAEALARELDEELGIRIEPPSTPPDALLVGPDFDLSVWIITQWSGKATNRDAGEHDAIRWFAPADIATVPVAHSGYRSMLAEAVQSRS